MATGSEVIGRRGPRTPLRAVVIVLIGIALGVASVRVEWVHRIMRFPTHPVLLASTGGSETEGTTRFSPEPSAHGKTPTPVERNATASTTGPASVTPANRSPASSAAASTATPRPSPRISWEVLDRDRPHSRLADPTTGRTQIMYLDAPLEMRLSATFARSRCPLPVLRVGVVTSAGRSIAGVEFWCGSPPSRPTIETAAVHLIALAFDTEKSLEEVDLVAIPWRTVRDYKSPVRFSVAARRVDYLPASADLAARQILERYGATWWDPRVMSDFPAPPAHARAAGASHNRN